MSTHDYRKLLDEHGFVIIPDLIAPNGEFERLRAACDEVVERTRKGDWPLRRVVGKQFPPWSDTDPDSWGVQMIMHPDLGEPAKVFQQWYTGDRLVGAVCDLLACKEEDLQMELFNLLINPIGHDFTLSWHRDDVRHEATAEEEEQALKIWHHGMQWNCALYEDSCLYVVPGSHKVVRTPEQRAQSTTKEPPRDPKDMPGAIAVTVKPGETVFYNSNLLHIGTYNSKIKRATLHGTMGDVRGGSLRARNILQHGLEWMGEPRFREGLSERGKRMLDHILKTKAEAGHDHGYSLDA